jgi:hypothetical protein
MLARTSSQLLDDLGPRVVVLVDAVAEAHQADLLSLSLACAMKSLRAHAALEPIASEHLDEASLAPPCSGPQRALTPADTLAKRFALERADHPHRRGRAVLLVVGVEDEAAG